MINATEVGAMFPERGSAPNSWLCSRCGEDVPGAAVRPHAASHKAEVKPGDEHLVAHLRLDSISTPMNVGTWVPDLGDDVVDPAVVVLSTEVGPALSVADARALAAALNLAATAAEQRAA